jgi:hypothetical protein
LKIYHAVEVISYLTDGARMAFPREKASVISGNLQAEKPRRPPGNYDTVKSGI